MDVRHRFVRSIRKFQMVSAGDRVVLAVSGGPDSTALLQLFLQSREELNVDLVVAHLNHGLRGEDSASDARFVEGMARSAGLPFTLGRVDDLKRKNSGNLEATARARRYAFLREVAAQHSAQRIATGHTLDDQAETVLMRFFREGGRKGVAGIPPVRDGLLIRPLLEISKVALLSYLEKRGVAYVHDLTNSDPRHLRNKMRHRIIPILLREVNPNLIRRISRLGELFRVENEYLDCVARDLLAAMVLPDGALDVRGIQRVPDALKGRVVRSWMGLGVRSETVHLDAVLDLVQAADKEGSVSLPGGYRFTTERGRGVLSWGGRNLEQENFGFVIEPGDEIRIDRIRALVRADLVPRVCVASNARAKGAFTEFFDWDRISGPILVRNRRPGDRIKLIGMKGRKLISDLFIDRKISRGIRGDIPLIVWGGEVQWVPGCARGNSALVVPKTSRVLRMTVTGLRLA